MKESDIIFVFSLCPNFTISNIAQDPFFWKDSTFSEGFMEKSQHYEKIHVPAVNTANKCKVRIYPFTPKSISLVTSPDEIASGRGE